MTKSEKIKIGGILFNLGWQSDCEFSGAVFEMFKDGKKYGALSVSKAGDELDFNSNVYATEAEAKACVDARQWMNENYKTSYKY